MVKSLREDFNRPSAQNQAQAKCKRCIPHFASHNVLQPRKLGQLSMSRDLTDHADSRLEAAPRPLQTPGYHLLLNRTPLLVELGPVLVRLLNLRRQGPSKTAPVLPCCN